MGRFKETNREGVNEIRENSEKTTEIGSKMREQGDKIHALLDSLTLFDDEDIGEIKQVEKSYGGSFDKAFKEQVESAGVEIGKQGEKITDSVDSELGNVHTGISSLEKASSISEIGREGAEAGKERLEKSAEEYEDIKKDAEQIVDETKKKIDDLGNDLRSIFG